MDSKTDHQLEKAKEYLADLVFDKSTNWNFPNIKDEVFELKYTGVFEMKNIRPYEPNFVN